MSWVIQNRTGKWYVGRGKMPDVPYGLTRHLADALPFATEADALRVKSDYLDTFASAYLALEIPDHGADGDAPDAVRTTEALYGPTDVV